MARISLRSYNQEIERLVDSGRTDEAIAHCRHILQSYPKCVDTYRMLGKAFLETQRYGDAADIFQRVLSSLPEDFVSHVGMSMIREDEGNLDEAIWHMERAFEVQPANSAIQEELRRLYGRRDGVAPLKIRLTRGALARMYFKGDLYQQAIAEIRAALAEDPNRLDLMTLLACVYAKAGQPVEAAENASTILRKLPNSIEANRIMADVLTGTEREAEVQTFRQRLIGLDPYAGHTTPSSPTSMQVPDQAISLEKLTWKPGQVVAGAPGQPTWATSLGIELSETTSNKEALPEWLTGVTGQAQPAAGSSAPPFEQPGLPAFLPETKFVEETPQPDLLAGLEEPTSEATPEEQIPDWMKSAGWGPSIGVSEQPPVELQPEEVPSTESKEGELAEAEIPEWLQAMAPTQETQEAPVEEENVLPWLEKILPSDQAEKIPSEIGETKVEAPEILGEAETEIPAWLTGAAEAGVSAKGEEELPEWLSEEQAEQPSEGEKPAEEAPAWIFEEQATQPTAETTPAEAIPAKELPAWLLGGQEAPIETTAAEESLSWLHEEPGVQPTTEVVPSEAAPVEELPAFQLEGQEVTPMAETTQIEESLPWPLEEQESQPSAEAISAEATPTGVAPAEELPAWLIEGQATLPKVEAGPSEAAPAEELPSWLLEGKVAETVAEIPPVEKTLEELPTDKPAFPVETGLPEWLTAAAVTEVGAEIAEEALEGELEKPEVQPAQPIAEPAVQPTAEAAPVEATPAEEIPAWLMEGQEAQPAASAPAIGEIPSEEAKQAAELHTWLFEEQPAIEAAPSGEALPAEGLPAWLFEGQGAQPAAEAAPVEVPPTEEAVPTEELPAWLFEGQGAQPAAEAAPVEVPPTEEAVPAEELPAWLFEGQEAQPAAEAAPFEVAPAEEAVPAEELPAWLFEGQEAQPATEVAPIEVPPAEEAVPAKELPAWLFEGQEAQPAPEAAPVEAAPAEEAVPAEELPAWLLEMREAQLETEKPLVQPEPEEVQAVAKPTTIPGEEKTPEMGDTEAAFAWLESLAVKQGAEEALLLKPEERLETPPEWVQEAALSAQQAVEEGIAPQEEAGPALKAELTELQPFTEEELAAFAVPEELSPEWLQEHIEAPTTPQEETPTTAAGVLPEAEKAIEEAPLPDWLKQLEEPPVIVGDTKPTKLVTPKEEIAQPTQQPLPTEPVAAVPTTAPSTSLSDEEAAFAWLESLAVKQGAEEALLLKPEERLETPPEWVQEAALSAQEVEAQAAPVEQITAPIMAEAAPVIEIPQPEETPPAIEAPAAGTPVEMPTQASIDADQAFAWLESLAVRQGAEEALLLKPEERRETPPEWVIQETLSTTAQPTPEVMEEIPEIEEKAVVPEEVEAKVISEAIPEVPVQAPELLAEIPITPVEEKPVPGEVEPFQAPTLAVEEELPTVETPISAEISAPEIKTEPSAEEMPELPSWLAGTAPEPVEEMEWTPPPVKPYTPINLNEASLVELERLPGIGFIMAQQIITYRDNNGPFAKVSDLMQVSGFTQANLDEIKDRLFVEVLEPVSVFHAKEALVLPVSGEFTRELGEARTELSQGNLEQAISGYNQLILTNQDLPHVIHDLEEVANLQPTSMKVWQSLGDAYLRAGQIQQALEAYVKAEKLLH